MRTAAHDAQKTNGSSTAAPSVQGKRNGSIGIVIALVFWLGVVCSATVLMTRYATSPGEVSSAPDFWPKESRIPGDPGRPTLIMFSHPHCPCTRASLGELERLLAQVSNPPNVFVVFVKPSGTADDWAATDLWRAASSIRGVRVFLDDNGVEAERFHARTSGETLFYDRDAKLRFQGGITLARGHAGDNPGRTSLRELLEQGFSNQPQTPVYGCGLLDEQCPKGNVSCKP